MRKSYDFSNAVQGVHHKQYEQGHSVRLITENESQSVAGTACAGDTQLTELAGRFALISQLTKDGLEVALPVRDRGIDMIAYADLSEQNDQFVACPIQLKVSTGRRFSLNKKYSRIANLLLVYVWDVQDAVQSRTYALTYAEACDILARKGFDQTDSWKGKRGEYSISPPGKELLEMMERYIMKPEGWHKRIVSAAGPVRLKSA
jgi:hypothetical protein